jgi:hypothetical protein
MFPNDVLETQIKVDDLNITMFLEITLTTQQKKEQRKVTERETAR